jgi:hypothetical protein
MKRINILTMACLALLVLFIVPSLVMGQLAEGERDTLFIGAIKIQPSVRELAKSAETELELNRASQSLETQFIQAVSATRVFQLVDRKRIAEIQAEQSFAAVSVDPADPRAAQLMKMAGARWAFLPEIDGFQVRTDTVEFQVGRESMIRKYFLSALVQIVDTTTGELLPDVPSIQLNEIETTEMAGIGQAQPSDAVLVGLARKLAGQLSQEAIAILRPAKILNITGNQIMINRGSEAGFTPGVPVEIYAYQNIVDEDTGEVFRNEIPVGRATVRRGDKRQSFAEIGGEDLGIAVGCIVKPVRSTAGPVPLAPVTWSGGKEAVGTEVAPRSESPETPGSSAKPLSW